jgi:chemotaxis signal transduction protein
LFSTRLGFGCPAREPRLSDHFIIVRARGRTAALRVDRAVELVHVDAALLHDPRIHVSVSDAVAGVATLPDGLVVIHDVHRFLSDAEDAALARALDAASRAASV